MVRSAAAVLSMLCACSPTPLVSAQTPSPADAAVASADAGQTIVGGPADAAVTDAGSLVCTAGDAGPAQFDPAYAFVHSDAGAQDKSFYLLTLFDTDPRLREAFRRNETLAALGAEHEAMFREAADACGDDLGCYRRALALPFADITKITAALPVALGPCEVTRLAQTHLRPSGLFVLHTKGSDEALLTESWADTAEVLVAAYEGTVASLEGSAVRALVLRVRAELTRPLAFYEPMLRVVIAALAAQGRDEAIRYDSLMTGHNAAAIARLGSISWADYPYTVMLVPGQGPMGSEALSLIGKARCDLAAANFAQKRAPLILLSGGHVHPDRTPFCEAVEMKKYLMKDKGIAESAILIDPYARHTVTNLRNFSRAIFRLGIPRDRPALVTSDAIQSLIISYQTPKDCRDKLGYEPFTKLTRVDSTSVSLFAAPEALEADGRDLLDP